MTTRTIEDIAADRMTVLRKLNAGATSLRHGSKETRFSQEMLEAALARLDRELADAQALIAGASVARPSIIYTRTTRGY